MKRLSSFGSSPGANSIGLASALPVNEHPSPALVSTQLSVTFPNPDLGAALTLEREIYRERSSS